MSRKILFIERKPYDSVSIEKAFRCIAANLSSKFAAEFQQLPYGNLFSDTIRNLLFFRKKNADLYHITGHTHYISLLFSRRNTVLSIMDVRFLYNKPGLKRWLLKKLYLDWPLRKLDFITAISEHTKSEIIRYTGCDPGKILMLDLPLMVNVEPGKGYEFNQQKPTILQIGTMDNKNIPTLAKALSGIACKLRIIGRLNAGIISALVENQVDYDNAYDLTDEQISKEYEMADIVAFCSTYEGFGLPIIEAQSMKRPVLTSNLSPMIETSGGGAVLANPFDYLSIRAGIEKLIGDADYRLEMVSAGLKNVERFRPAIVAAQYEKLYTQILGNKSADAI